MNWNYCDSLSGNPVGLDFNGRKHKEWRPCINNPTFWQHAKSIFIFRWQSIIFIVLFVSDWRCNSAANLAEPKFITIYMWYLLFFSELCSDGLGVLQCRGLLPIYILNYSTALSGVQFFSWWCFRNCVLKPCTLSGNWYTFLCILYTRKTPGFRTFTFHTKKLKWCNKWK